MHVGLIIYGRLDTVSGGYLYDRQVVDYLRRQGDRVEVISLPWSNYARHLGHNLLPGLRQRLRHASFDILLQDELNHPSLFWLNRRLRHSRSYPLVAIVHHLRSSESRPAWQNAFYGRIEKRYLESVDGFIFNSQTTRAAVEHFLGVQRPHLVAYPAGDHVQPTLTMSAITARAREPGPLRLLFVGNVIARKGVETLLAALRRLPPGTWRLEVAGDMTADLAYTRRIQRQIERYGLSGRVKLHGAVPVQRLNDLYRRSHLLAVPSRYEGFGIVYLEGMAFGLPAIATTAGAAHEVIRHGESGFLIAPGAAAELAGYIECLSRDRSRLAQMSEAARRRYTDHPTWDDSMLHVRHFLKEMEIGD